MSFSFCKDLRVLVKMMQGDSTFLRVCLQEDSTYKANDGVNSSARILSILVRPRECGRVLGWGDLRAHV